MILSARIGPERRYLTTAAAVAVIIAAMFVLDRTLARIERTELEREAHARYDAGMRLIRTNAPAALNALQRAHALVRTNHEYSLGLIEALLAAGRTAEAESRVRDLLKEESNNATANLLLARLLASESNVDEAVAFYHRAIYGIWSRNADSQRLNARLELAEYLAGQHRSQELLSELLLLEERADTNPELAPRLAGLFLAAGSHARAAQIYREILRRSPNDVQAYEGLAETDLVSGDYRAAESTLRNALRHDPKNATLAKRLQFAATLEAMDPTPRRLKTVDKYTRSTALLQTIRGEVQQCRAVDPKASAPLIAAADQNIDPRKGRAAITNDAAEARLVIAERLWDVLRRACPPSSSADDPTMAIMEKLKRTE